MLGAGTVAGGWQGGFPAQRRVARICLIPLPRISIPVPGERERIGSGVWVWTLRVWGGWALPASTAPIFKRPSHTNLSLGCIQYKNVGTEAWAQLNIIRSQPSAWLGPGQVLGGSLWAMALAQEGLGGVKGDTGGIGFGEARLRLGPKPGGAGGWVGVRCDFGTVSPGEGRLCSPPLDGIKEPLLHSCGLGGHRFLSPKWPARHLRGVIETLEGLDPRG